MSSNLADLLLDLQQIYPPWYLHLVIKMGSNLADLLLVLPADLPSLVLTSSGQDEFKFGRSMPND